MNSRQYTALPLVLALLCTPAVGGQKPASGNTPAAPVVLTPEHFEHLDTNRDGVLSEAEYQQFMKEAFKKLDKDGSGGLTLDEVETLLTPAQFKEVDRNDDGKITLDELIDHVMKDFQRADSNKDGKLQR